MSIRERKSNGLGLGGLTGRLDGAAYQAVFDRRFATEPSMPEFIRQADALMREGRILKEDAASFVSRVIWNGCDTVVKRYNHRGLWHSFRHTIKGSRARRNWFNGHRLASLEIATAEPLAYVEQFRGPLLWQSYFVARFVPGLQVQQILRDKTVAESQKQRLHDQVLQLLRLMAEHGISHGDMKHTNILYDGTSVVLIDLDGMRVGGTRWLRRRRYRRDVERYSRDLAGLRITSTPSQGSQ
jgi:serine/threonine protein kinase